MDFECRLRGAEYLAYPPVVAGMYDLGFPSSVMLEQKHKLHTLLSLDGCSGPKCWGVCRGFSCIFWDGVEYGWVFILVPTGDIDQACRPVSEIG